MFDGLGTEVNTIIDNLCSKFGVTVDTLLPELCKYNVYKAIGYISAFSIVIVASLLCMIILNNIRKKTDDIDLYGVCILVMVILLCVSVVLVACISYNVYQLIVWKNAPTGAAVNYVLQQLKNR